MEHLNSFSYLVIHCLLPQFDARVESVTSADDDEPQVLGETHRAPSTSTGATGKKAANKRSRDDRSREDDVCGVLEQVNIQILITSSFVQISSVLAKDAQ